MSRPSRLLRCKEVLERTGMPRSSLYKRIAAREFPAQIPIGGQAVAWLEDEVEHWIGQCVAARDAGSQPQARA